MKSTSTTSMTVGIMALAALTLLSQSKAEAGAIISITQSGSDVIETGSGTINLSALTFVSGGNAYNAGIGGAGAIVGGGAAGGLVDVYSGIVGPSSFGSGITVLATSGTGQDFAVAGIFSQLALPQNYISGASLSQTAIFAGTTLASLGLTSGTYVWTWGTPGVNLDSFTVQIGSVPEPSSVALVMLPLGFMLFKFRRRRA